MARPASDPDTLPGGTVALPALVKGRIVQAPDLSAGELDALWDAGEQGQAAGSESARSFEHATVIRHPVIDQTTLVPTGESQYLVLPTVDPRELIENDPGELARSLYSLPFREVLAYAEGLSRVLNDGNLLAHAARSAAATSWLGGRFHERFFASLPGLFDRDGLGAAVDRGLATGDHPGSRYLDGWAEVSAAASPGPTAIAATQIGGYKPPLPRVPLTRAMPTRQLHITAGNAPIVPAISFLRALSTKGAAVIKSPSGATATAAVLAHAMARLDPDHPITRHTSLVYWKGGERRVEDVLFAPGNFDRLLVWGAADTMSSVTQRATDARQILLRPRVGMSLIGHQVFADDVDNVAARAAVDVMVANQAGCTSSLVHYVEGSEVEVLEYCRALQGALATWDRALPHRLPPQALGRLRRLKRGAFLRGTWFENGRWPDITSAVVYLPNPFDLAAHPMSRCVVVRAVRQLADAVQFFQPGISTVGVYPEPVRVQVRDELAARGVSTILPLGDTECAYIGMPHDGMHVLHELVNWVNS
ncbi:acyl-CoA reductase [Nocardia sp. NPDC051052]|uniref:acyl-CoA reductase n=1 Tax=Nocardia sp. NPDC051052 TaxID=3364322 RepID=UPI00379A26DD